MDVSYCHLSFTTGKWKQPVLKLSPQVAVSQGGWRTTSVLKLLVNVNMSKLKVTCSAVNKLYRNTVEDTKTIRILSKS